jgi:hypothetical protein
VSKLPQNAKPGIGRFLPWAQGQPLEENDPIYRMFAERPVSEARKDPLIVRRQGVYSAAAESVATVLVRYCILEAGAIDSQILRRAK